jgi:MYXO-CTERM domain-containing protein
MKRIVVGAAALLLVCTAAPSALANGRFPRAQRLLEDPAEPDHLLLAATFGLLTTPDRGQNWYDECEAAFAQNSGYAGDPILERVAGGALLVDVQSSINRSADGCGWTPTLGSLQTAATDTFEDFAVDSAGNTIVALATHLASGVATIRVQESTDGGLTWKAMGAPLHASMVFTIDLDPTNAAHIFVTGLSPTDRSGIFLTSTDAATTWTATPIPQMDPGEAPYIAAVDPHDPKKIFVRTDSWILPDGAPELVADDALLYSADGGATWSELLRKSAKLLGFALSPDGSTVLAGYGDPVQAGHDVDPDATGIYQASTSDFQFAPVFPVDAQGNNANVTCLTWTGQGVYVCLESASAGTYEELAFFPNGTLDLDGAAPEPLMHLRDVKGPPPCCAVTDALCAWPIVCQTYPFFGCAEDAGTAPACAEAPDARADGTDASAAPGGEVDATTAEPGDAALLSADAALISRGGPPPPASPGAGCGCRVEREEPPRTPVLLALAGLAGALVRRRRRSAGRRRTRRPPSAYYW